VRLVHTKLPVTVSHKACDLAGVLIKYGAGADQVPGSALPVVATTCNDRPGYDPGCPSVSLNEPTLDVTISRVN
jgi:hypothetical protein